MITKRLRPAFYACVLSSLLAFLPAQAQAENNAQYTIQEISDIINAQDGFKVTHRTDDSAIATSFDNKKITLGLLKGNIIFLSQNLPKENYSNTEINELNAGLFGKIFKVGNKATYVYTLPNSKEFINQDHLLTSFVLASVDLTYLKEMK